MAGETLPTRCLEPTLAGFRMGYAYRIYLGSIIGTNLGVADKTRFLDNLSGHSHRLANAKGANENPLNAVELSRRLVSCIGNYSLCCSLPQFTSDELAYYRQCVYRFCPMRVAIPVLAIKKRLEHLAQPDEGEV